MSKKTETIEIRVSPELKTDLSRASASEGRTMSDLVRDLIEDRMCASSSAARGDVRRRPLHRAAIVGLPSLALAAVYLFSAQAPATAHAELRDFFNQVDTDGDGRIVLTEVEELVRPTWFEGILCDDGTDPCTVASHAAFHLRRSDKDGSGDVSYAEFQAVNLRDWAADFLAADRDENGHLSADEMVADHLARVLRQPNHPGSAGVTLSDACVAWIEATLVDGVARVCDREAEGARQVADFDTDGDGAVTLAEYLRR